MASLEQAATQVLLEFLLDEPRQASYDALSIPALFGRAKKNVIASLLPHCPRQ
jgi:hypothetical protein